MNDVKQYINQSSRYRMEEKDKRTSLNRKQNSATMDEDFLHIRRNQEQLTREEQMEEFMFLGLRRCEGVRRDDFQQRFHESIDIVYGDVLIQLERKELITSTDNWIRLTEYGIDISNSVLSEFLLH